METIQDKETNSISRKPTTHRTQRLAFTNAYEWAGKGEIKNTEKCLSL